MQSGQTTIFQLGQLVQIIIALGLLHLLFHSIDFLLHLAHAGNGSLLSIPTLYQLIVSLTQLIELFIKLYQTLLGSIVILLGECLRFDFQL